MKPINKYREDRSRREEEDGRGRGGVYYQVIIQVIM